MAAGLPTSVKVEIEFTAGVWTDVTTSVQGNPGVSMRYGRGDEYGANQPGSCSFVLDNVPDSTTGICPFTPDSPLSPYYPNIIEGKRVRVTVTKTVTFQRFIGKLSSIVPNFTESEAFASVSFAADDLWADLQSHTMQSVWSEYWQAMANSQSATWDLWPLDDATNATTLHNLNGVAASIVQPPLGAGSAKLGTAEGLLTEGMITLTHDSSANHYGPFLTLVPSWSSLTTGTGSIMFAFRTTDSGNTTPLISFWTDPIPPQFNSGAPGVRRRLAPLNYAGKSQLWAITLQPDGTLTVRDAFGAVLFNFGGVFCNDGQWHTVVLSGTSATHVSLYLDGGSAYGGTGALFSLDLAGTSLVTLGGSGKGAQGFQGDLAAIATSTANSSGGHGGFEFRAVPGNANPIQDTVKWLILSYKAAAVAGTDYLFHGSDNRMVGYDTVQGSSLADVLSKYATTVGASVWMNTGGQIEFNLSDYMRPRTSIATITLGADDDISTPQTWKRGIDSTPTRVTATSPAGSVLIVDDVAETAGRRLDATVDTFAATTTDAADAAYARLLSSPKLRLTQIKVDLVTASNALYTTLCQSMFPGARVTVASVPSGVFGVTSTDVYVMGWNEIITTDSYSMVLDTIPADAPTEGVWDTSRFGFGDGICTGTSGTAVGTTAVGTLVLTWTGGEALSTSAGDYPMDLDWNGERVTVTAAPAGSASPQTVTITARGVAPSVARVHSAGESVEVYDVGRFAF